MSGLSGENSTTNYITWEDISQKPIITINDWHTGLLAI